MALFRFLALTLAISLGASFAPSRTFVTKCHTPMTMDLSFDGNTDLERALGTKKFKKQEKRMKQLRKNMAKEAELAAIKKARRATHLSSSTSDEDGEASGLKLLIW